MSWLRMIWSRSSSALRKNRLDREFDEELTTHLELLTDEYRRSGMSNDDARRAARQRLGSLSLREQHRDQRGLPLADALMQDLRYAVRMLWKAPAFTLIVTFSLALGIGANIALFSLVDGLLLRSLPVRDPDQLVRIEVAPVMPGGFKKPMIGFEQVVFHEIRAHTQLFSSAVGFWRVERPIIAIDGVSQPEREVQNVSANFFRDLGVAPIMGRAPDESDDNVAIVSDRWRRAHFADAGSGVIGKVVSVNSKNHTIIGVAPPRFHGFVLENSADIWLVSRAPGNLRMIARLQPGVTPLQAQAGVHSYFRDLLLARMGNVPKDQLIETDVLPSGQGMSQLREEYQGALWSLMALVVVVLLTTCTNVGNLLMLRNAARMRELTVRAALGAARGRLILQYFVENTLLAAIGCGLGLLLARWGVSLIVGMLPLPATPDALTFYADARVLTFAIAVSFVAALMFGLAPAWRATAVDLSGSLRSSQGTTSPRSTRRLGRMLVSGQVGLSVVLLVAAGLFVQTLRNLANQDIGFSPDQLLQASIDTRGAGYRDGQVGPVYRLLLERVGAVSGVRSVTGARNTVMRNSQTLMAIRLPGMQRPNDEMWQSAEVGPKFFETMGFTLIRGRTFTYADFEVEGPRYVVNEAFAERYFPNDDPVSRNIGIVGIVKNVKFHGVRGKVEPMMYERSRPEPDRVNAILVRTNGDSDSVVPAIREAIISVNPRLLLNIRTMREDMERDIAKERMVATISAFFSGLGLLLVSVGIFGVASYTIAQRTKELAIRRALGAGRWSVIREALRETMVVFALGLAAGTVLAVVLVRFTASVIADLLFGLTATNALNIALAVAAMVTAAAIACILPAHRATSIDPLIGIRDE